MAVKQRYAFRAGAPFNKKYAQPIGEYLETQGHLRPATVVKLGKDGKCPELTSIFNWNDKDAAASYRLTQARTLLNSLYIINITDQPIKAYESVRFNIKDDLSYVSTSEVAENEGLLEQVLFNAKRELFYWESKYALYKTKLPKIFAAIRSLRKEKTNGKEGSKKGRGRKR